MLCKLENIVTQYLHVVCVDRSPEQAHIMISYQWDSQATMVQVKDRLRQAGYKVWMDVEHMSEYT